jgi:predicted phage terminase large subunit-like protein
VSKHLRSSEALKAALRVDFGLFVQRCFQTLNPGCPFEGNWHIDAMGYQLKRISTGDTTRLIINLPPRQLKSTVISVAFAAYMLGHDPRRRIIVLSYGSELSDKHSSDFRAIVQSRWYRETFPKMRIRRDVGDELTTTLRGFRKSTSVGGTLTGLGGNLFIIDDPQKPVDAQSDNQRENLNRWFSSTLLSRLDNQQTSAIIVVQQRVHQSDLSGFLLESGGWDRLCLPAIADRDENIQIGEHRFYFRKEGEALHPAREGIESLRKLQQSMVPDDFAAQYQQGPVPPGGAMIKRAWLKYYDSPPKRGPGAKVIQSWDTAGKDGPQNDWCVCTTWLLIDGHYYLLDLVRGRFQYPELRKTALALAERFKPNTVLIEDTSSGVALAQELRKIRVIDIQAIKVRASKQERVYVQQEKFLSGRVLFPKGASFLPELERELLSFPHGKTDDQVDSITQALAYEHSGGYDSTLSWVG